MTEPCQHPDTWFSRTVCAEPCGTMHTHCTKCAARLDDCAHDVPPPAPVQPEPDEQRNGEFICDQNPHPAEIPCGRCQPKPQRRYVALRHVWEKPFTVPEGGMDFVREVIDRMPPAEPPPLDEAEVIARHVATLNPWAGVVMAELDRVRAELREVRQLLNDEREIRRRPQAW